MVGKKGKAALAVVDMQEDFCEPHGSLAIKGARELAPKINGLLDHPGFALTIATQDYHPPDHISFASQHANETAEKSRFSITNPENEDEVQVITLWPDHCVQGTRGVDIIPEINKSKISHIVQKGWDKRLESYSGFGPPFRKPAVAMTELQEFLHGEGITDLYVVGVAFDGCVKHTALDAVEFGMKTYIVESGVNAAARSEGIRAGTLSELRERGVVLIRDLQREGSRYWSEDLVNDRSGC